MWTGFSLMRGISMLNGRAHVLWCDSAPGVAQSNQFNIVMSGQFTDAAQLLVSTSMCAVVAVGALGCIASFMRRAVAG